MVRTYLIVCSDLRIPGNRGLCGRKPISRSGSGFSLSIRRAACRDWPPTIASEGATTSTRTRFFASATVIVCCKLLIRVGSRNSGYPARITQLQQLVIKTFDVLQLFLRGKPVAHHSSAAFTHCARALGHQQQRRDMAGHSLVVTPWNEVTSFIVNNSFSGATHVC